MAEDVLQPETVALDPGPFVWRRQQDDGGHDQAEDDDYHEQRYQNSAPVALRRVAGYQLLKSGN